MARKFFNDYIKKLNKEDLENYYIKENHNQEEVLDKFNISNLDMLHKILLYYKIEKPTYLINEKRNNSLLNKSEEEKLKIKQKISESNKNKILSQETKNKISKSNKGKKSSLLGKKQSKEASIKKSTSLKNHYKKLSIQDRKNQNKHISNYFKNATTEQLNNRRLKKINSLSLKTKDEKLDSYIKNLNTRGINPSQLFLDLRFDLDKAKNYLINNPSTYYELSNKFNVTYNCLFNWLEQNNLNKYLKNEKSNYENQIANYLDSLNIEYIKNDRKVISPQELDFYIPDKNIAIEFNGDY